MIYTFYSYKGGVGRSMALANVGELFYQAGLNVLLVDWDLEAPGLERFFGVDAEEKAAQPGVMDMLLDYKQQMTQESTETEQFPFKKPSDFAIDLHPDSSKGRLRLLTAGQRDKANFTRYANAVLTFDWKDFYDNWEGEAYFEWLRQQFLEMADVVLIDSRTGITEMGGVCTYQLGDVIVMFCGTSRQNLEGTVQMVAELKSAAVEKARSRSLEVMVVPARVDKSNMGDFRQDFVRRFSRYTPEVFKRNSDYFWQLIIPYAPVCAYKEMILAPGDPTESEDVYKAFAQLTFALSRLAADNSTIRAALPEKEFQVGDARVVGSAIAGNIVITGDGARVIIGELPVETPAVDPASALANYLRHLIAQNRYLTLQGIRSGGKLVSIELEHVYVTLRATRQCIVTDEDTWLKEEIRATPSELPNRRSTLSQSKESQIHTETVTVSVNEALSASPRLVVLGNPGSGKTTLLRYLAMLYARDLAEGNNLLAERLGLIESERLPVFIPLRRLGAYLKSRRPADDGTEGSALLLEYLRQMLAGERMDLPQGFFDPYLETGNAVVLFDGLDEVTDPDLRRRTARLIEAMTLAYPHCRYIVSSRIVGYTGAARLGGDYVTTTMRDFTDADIAQFLHNWHLAVAVGQMGPGASAINYAEGQTAQLTAALQANERLRELAINPLLLTVIALVHRDRVKLPGRRAELYAEVVDVLLGKWDEAKGTQEIVILPARSFDAGDKRLLLQRVALHMHESQQREIALDELRHLLASYFETLLTDVRQISRSVELFIQMVEERIGLLVARGEGVYAFSHLVFQEYLAAISIAARDDYITYTLKRCSTLWWREVILLEAGYLSTQSRERTTRLIQAVADCKNEPEPYQNLALAAEMSREVGDSRVEGELRVAIQHRLRLAVATPLPFWSRWLGIGMQTWVTQRSAAMEALVRIGAGYWTLPYGEPEWIEIPAGEFWMGSEGQDAEEPVHRVHLKRYLMAKTLIANAQYRLFVTATGHRAPVHWENGATLRGWDSHPVVNVTWHDAMAYCQWLSQVTGKSITLLSEAEWEKAARSGKDKREYPWGQQWHEGYCNSEELGINGTTPVGIFPEGASLFGCLDMMGNVWEWTRSLIKLYPYQASDGREDLDVGDDSCRVVRGGAFDVSRKNMRCSVRSAKQPNVFERTIGFRVVVVPEEDNRND